ncbi:hypothetical protein [Mariniflexile sp.]|uniref:hypothetical protein n=1 Tax=Mariniflexile sp. TaxID=1979402 RepID=UPI0040472CE1
MAGIYLDNNLIKKSIQSWSNTIIPHIGNWEGNNLHIDEIDSLEKIERSEWIDVSFMILNILVNKFMPINSLILFLHIDLKYSLKKMSLDKMALNWLNENVSEYTPPSLHFTSLDYYKEFYEKELVVFKPDDKILELFHSRPNLEFFYRTYFDEEEEMYSREIYVFVKK